MMPTARSRVPVAGEGGPFGPHHLPARRPQTETTPEAATVEAGTD